MRAGRLRHVRRTEAAGPPDGKGAAVAEQLIPRKCRNRVPGCEVHVGLGVPRDY